MDFYIKAGSLVETRLTKACIIVCYDYVHPKYLETDCVHSDVTQILDVYIDGRG